MHKRLAITFILALILAAGCAGSLPGLRPLERGQTAQTRQGLELVAGDPEGPIAEPALPPGLAAAREARPRRGERLRPEAINYQIECRTPKTEELCRIFENSSRLALMIETPVYTMVALEQRLGVSLKEGRDILHSRGYYGGTVEGRAERSENGLRAVVKVQFEPGPRYLVGPTRIIPEGPGADSALPAGPLMNQGQLPRTLADVGLPEGAKALADDLLEAVDRVQEAFRNNGYPLARITNTRYTVDHKARTLEAAVWIEPGAYALMGPIKTDGPVSVKPGYLEAQRYWSLGRPWNQRRVEAFRESLLQSGLFQQIEINPDLVEDSEGRRAVLTRLDSAPARTVGGAVKYDSDFGPGLQAYWEHRNLTGWGDRLRLDLPVWQDLQQFTAVYRRPYFRRRGQDFLFQGGVLHENADAYNLYSGAVSAGAERRLSRYLRGRLKGAFEAGSLKESGPGRERRDYYMLGWPAQLAYDRTNDYLNATRGGRLTVSAAPYTGHYFSPFNVIRARVEGQVFLPFTEKERLVMAARGVWGALWDVDPRRVPTSIRFYSGGGGSVRGYEYQSVGPRDGRNRPLGGAALLEVGAEGRFRFNETLGMAAFVDGGMVYDKAGLDVGRDLLWGAGLGFRYFTGIGPLRLDVAAPLNPRDDDSAFQLYISIGQSF